MHLATRSHAVDMALRLGHFPSVNVYAGRPAKNRETICVRDREPLACQILLASKLLVQSVKSFTAAN
jgi:hypothetical protein